MKGSKQNRKELNDYEEICCAVSRDPYFDCRLYPRCNGCNEVAGTLWHQGYVRHLQEDLNTYGDYDLDEDGYYGKYTKLAVISFQKSVGLNDDGWAGDNTKKALYNAVYGTNF